MTKDNLKDSVFLLGATLLPRRAYITCQEYTIFTEITLGSILEVYVATPIVDVKSNQSFTEEK